MRRLAFSMAAVSGLFFALPTLACDRYIDSCEVLDTDEEVVCLSSDIATDALVCIAIIADEVVLDCGGHRVTYTENERDGFGIHIPPYSDDVTVRNCEVNHWANGIKAQAKRGFLQNNKAFDNTVGILVNNTTSPVPQLFAYRTEVANNKLDDNDVGIKIFGNADENWVHNNTVHNSENQGIYCSHFISAGLVPDGNIIEHNQVNLNGRDGITLTNCRDGEVSFNTTNLNGGDGIGLGVTSQGNDVFKNRSNRNGWPYVGLPAVGIRDLAPGLNSYWDNVCKNNYWAPSFPDIEGLLCK